MEPDFSGWATKVGLKCSDGRTIKPGAFAHMDKQQVPLVWSHGHNSVENVLGYAILEERPDGVYAKGYFNNTKAGQTAKLMVQHGDVNKLSIYANQLKEQAKMVLHGMIREVSLVLAGANPGAVIDYVSIRHGDEVIDLDDTAIIHTGEHLEHIVGVDEKEGDAEESESLDHADKGVTVQDVYDSLSQEQKDVVHYMIGEALRQNGAAAHSDTTDKPENESGDEGDLSHEEGTDEVRKNVFEAAGGTGQTDAPQRVKLSADDVKGIIKHAMSPGNTLKTAVEFYALQHGVENLDLLFPDAKTINNRPELLTRRMEWVSSVMTGTRKTPFARVKSIVADLTQDEARAMGYIKGNYKKEEWFTLAARTTTPTTVYKKQKLDRDDIIDVTDFDIVAWLKAEMRMMLEEEIARAILLGDGRDVGSVDKIRDPAGVSDGAGIRSIVNENELYAVTVNVNLADASSSYTEVIEGVLRSRRFYKGSGSPTLYTTEQNIVEMLLTKDTTGRRYYNTKADLAAALMVSDIIPVEPMEQYPGLFGVIVNLNDYNIGTDAGGEVTMFDDFDIDYNQQKYLMETRLSGALTKAQSALIIRTTLAGDVLVDPVTDPTFNTATGVVTIPTQTGVVYKNGATNATLTAGTQSALSAGSTLNVKAVPASGYFFSNTYESKWTFTRPHA